MAIEMSGIHGLELNSRLVTTGIVLIGVGTVLTAAGMGITTSALVAASRRWVQQLETPPSELVRQNWIRARKATGAGIGAWRDADLVSTD